MNPNDFRRIDLACAADDTYPILETIYLHEGYLYAADGYIAVRLPATQDEENTTDGLLPRRAVRMARMAHAPLTALEELITVSLKTHNAVFERPLMDKSHDAFLPAVTKAFTRPGAYPETHNPHFVVDACLLWRLAKAVCRRDSTTGYGLKIFLSDNPDNPILVQPCGESNTLGAIMPMARGMTGNMAEDKLDLWHTLSKLKKVIGGEAEKIELSGELLEELRKLL